MGGFCGVVSRQDCVSDLFYGTDYIHILEPIGAAWPC